MPERLITRTTAALAMLLIGSVIACAQTPESRPAVPSSEKQAEIHSQLDETLGLSQLRSKADKEQAIAKLMEIAEQSSESPDDLYVSLKTAIPLIRETGDFATHQIAVQKLTETFSAAPLQEQTQLLLEFISASKSKEALAPAVESLAGIAFDAGQANGFDSPLSWLATADKAAKKARDNTSVTLIAATRGSLMERKAAFDAHEKATQSLAANAEDTKANLAEGHWLAIYENNWDSALPRLAKGSDAKWQAAAKAELAASEDAESQLKTADAWWDVAQSAGPGQAQVQQRALDWYTRAEPNVTSAVTRAKVAKRKEELTAKLSSLTDSGSTLHKPVASKIKLGAKGENELPIGVPINLLETVKLPDYAVSGNWTWLDGSIVGQASPQQRFMVPVVVTGNYEITCKFTRRTGNGDVSLMFPVGNGGCLLACLPNVFGLHRVNGKAAWDLTDGNRTLAACLVQ